jgi:hypothetical protein
MNVGKRLKNVPEINKKSSSMNLIWIPSVYTVHHGDFLETGEQISMKIFSWTKGFEESEKYRLSG